jgi:LEA14-like dessication related protein
VVALRIKEEFALPRVRSELSVLVAVWMSVLAVVVFASDDSKPQIAFKGLSANAIDLDKRTVDVTIKVEVKNPGPRFVLKDLRYLVRLNDEEAALGKSKKDIEVAAGSTSVLELPLTIKVATLPSVSWNSVMDGFKVRYQIQTEGTVPLFASLSRKLKFESAGELSLSDAISRWYAKAKERLTSR